MMKSIKHLQLLMLGVAAIVLVIQACRKKTNTTQNWPAVKAAFGNTIDLNNLENYASQTRPAYITKDNSGANPITNAGATLGRVLFYDVKLSVNNDIACGSCHQQAFAFGDNKAQSTGTNGKTARHTMRIINPRFGQEMKFFWDERSASLEQQSTQPIQNHNEMGYSGTGGDPGINELLAKLQAVDYYKELFRFVYGDEKVTETRIQNALSQFMRSIQSFDSKFDAGFAQVNNLNDDFPNYSNIENQGKRLFLAPPPGAPGAPPITGAGCQACHRAPEFDIDPNSLNNGITGVIGSPGTFDFTITRAPSLRDVVNASGTPNGPFMHDAVLNDLAGVINHYNQILTNAANTNLDPRLNPAGSPQKLNLTSQQKDALIAFLGTLTGKDVYTNKKWSSPFP